MHIGNAAAIAALVGSPSFTSRVVARAHRVSRIKSKSRQDLGFRFRVLGFKIWGGSLGIKTAQKPYIVWSLGPKALIYESLDS